MGPWISPGLSLVPGSKWFTWSTFLFKTKWSLPDQNHSQRHRKSEQDSRILLNGSTKASDFTFLKQQIGQLAQTRVVLTWIIKPDYGFSRENGGKSPSDMVWNASAAATQLSWLALKRPVRAKCLLVYSNSICWRPRAPWQKPSGPWDTNG